jgi:hypothetical protein
MWFKFTHAMGKFGDKKGLVLYTGEQVLGGFGGKNLHAVPLSALWDE